MVHLDLIARRSPSPSSRNDVDGFVPLGADQDPYGWTARKPSASTSQPTRRSTAVPGRGQAGEVGHHAARDEADRRPAGSPSRSSSQSPATCSAPAAAGEEPADRRSGPTPSQPVGPEGGREHSADHPAEEPGRRHRHHAGLGSGHQLLDDGQRIRPSSQRTTERGGHLVDVRPGVHRPARQSAQEVERLGQHPFQHRPLLIDLLLIDRPLAGPSPAPSFSTPRVMCLPRSWVGTRVWSLPVRRASRFGRWAATV